MDLKIHSDFSKANLDEMRGIYNSVGWTRTQMILLNKFMKQVMSFQ
jgi:hypothetical protein